MSYRINLVLAALLLCFASSALAADELAVTDLSVSGVSATSLNLTWTAPTGTPPAPGAAYYDVRYSTVPITDAASFNAAVPIGGVAVPKAASGSESLTVGGLACGTGYYFALTAHDQAGGSVLSNADGSSTASCSTSFSVSAAVTGASSLYASAKGDFNGDGNLDLAFVVGSGSTGNIVVYPGNGAGSFGSPVSSTGVTGNYPLTPAAADINGDGTLDLLVPNFFSGTVSILLGNGAGAFTSGGTVSTGFEPQGVIVVGDFNRDGKVDFALPLWGGHAVQVFIGDGNGGFTLKGSYGGFASSSRLHNARVADFDQDGKLDIAVADYGIVEIGWGNTVGFLKGNGDGSFQNAVTYNLGKQPGFLEIMDLNRDGRIDLVTGSLIDKNVSVFLGNGDGIFATAVNYAIGAAPNGASINDFNGDGIPDIMTGGDDNQNLFLLVGNGDGTFQTALPYPVVANVRQIVGDDFNRDGRPDLMVLNTAQNSIYFAANSSPRPLSANFFTAQILTTGANPTSVKVADLNRDGRPDLFTSNEGGNSISVFYGNGDGSFQSQIVFAAGLSPDGIVVGDLNRDGFLDLLAINDTNSFSRYFGSVSGFSGPVGLTLGGANNDDAVLADVNRDGVTDLVAVYNAGQDFSRVAVHLGAGDGSFGAKTEFSAGSYANSVTSADFNRDGRVDLAVGNYNGNDVSILLGAGDGTFGVPVNYAVTAGPITMTSADFNRDGRPDLAVPNHGGSTVSILLGNGDGSFQPKVDYAAGTNPQTVVSGDLDRDGIADLVVASRGGSSVYLLRGRGDGTFWPAESVAAGSSPIYPVLGDFNGDGRLDIAVANYADSTVSIMLNGAPLPVVPQLGLVAHWRGENSALDSVGGNHGAIAGGTDYAQGVVGSTFRFNGTDTSMVNVSHSPSLDITGAITMSAWINLSNLAGYSEILFKGDRNGTPGIQSYALEITPAGAVTVVLFGSTGDIFTTAPGLITAGQWYHLAATWDGSTSSQNNVKLYRNGSLVQSWTKTSALASTTQSLAIGSHKGLNNTNGLIDEVAIYNRALSAEEIRRVTSSVPNAFSFTPVANAQPSAAYESNAITVSGITVSSPVSITGGQYALSADGGATWSAWTNSAGTVNLGEQVKVLQVSSALASSPTTATLTIAGVSADYVVITTSSPAVPQVSLNGLISAWRAEGNALDSVGSNHAALLNGTTFATGKAGQAFSLDGSNDVIAAPAFDIGLDWTVAGWFAPSACSSIGVCPLFARSTGNTEGLLLAYLNHNFSTPANRGRFVFDIGDGSTWQIEGYSSGVFSDNAWHHVAISKSGDTYALFVDGQQQFQATTGGVSTAYQAHGIRIGHWSYGSGETYTGGRFDEIMVFDRPLSSKEILKLSNPGLISIWKAENDAVDSAGTSDGTWQGTAAYAAGQSGQAFSFDGSGTRIDMADSIGDFGANPFTVAFWLNDSGSAYPSDGYIIGKSHPDGGQGWDIRIKDRQIRVVGVNGWGFNITSDASLTPHVWHHVALSATGTEVNLYIDGALKGTSPRATISTTPNPLRLGFATNYGGSPLDGLLDEASIYNRALSAAEVADQYGLVSLWRAENDALDSVGSNSGSPQGAVTYAGGINGGQAFSLNGSDSSIRVAAPSGLPSGAAARTVAAWIRSAGPTSGTKYQTVFGYGSPGIDGGSFLLEWGGEANDRRIYLTGWNRDLAGRSLLSYGQWYHVAATYDGTTVRLYVNGIEDASASRSLNTVIGSNYAAIGTSPPNDGWHSFFNGLIDDLSVFDRVLGAADVATLSGMVPDQFSFAPLVSATLVAEYESAPVHVTGLTYATSVSVAGGQYAVSGDGTNWGAWGSSAGNLSPGSWVKLKTTSSASYGATATVTLTIGGVSAGFSVKTRNSVIGSAPGGNGSISCTSPVDEHGQSICSITPDYGYHLDMLTDNGTPVIGSISQSGNYTIADITANHDVIAGFAINIYTVTATAGANGSISPFGALPYQHGSSSAQFAVTPDNGYHILSVRKDGEDIMVPNSVGFDAPPFTGIVGDHAIDAVFTVNLDPGPARIVSPQADYQTLQDAYTAVAGGGEIRLLATLPGAPAFFATQAKTVRINGGYGSGYSLPTGGFTTLGRFTVSNGKVLANGVKVR